MKEASTVNPKYLGEGYHVVTAELPGPFQRRTLGQKKLPYVIKGSHVRVGDLLGEVIFTAFYTQISAPVFGQVVQILARHNQQVAEGDPLFVIKLYPQKFLDTAVIQELEHTVTVNGQEYADLRRFKLNHMMRLAKRRLKAKQKQK